MDKDGLWPGGVNAIIISSGILPTRIVRVRMVGVRAPDNLTLMFRFEFPDDYPTLVTYQDPYCRYSARRAMDYVSRKILH